MNKQINGMYARECGDLVWWCEGLGDTVGEPEIRVTGGEDPETIPLAYGARIVVNAFVFCTGCGRMAPEVNGCRYVLKDGAA